MPIQHIHTFLVHPKKHSHDSSRVSGTDVPLYGSLFRLLNDVYYRSDQECNIDIIFRHTADGTPQNECRDLIRAYVRNPSLAAGTPIARRLEENTDGRSGLGLLFLIAGNEQGDHKLVVSRFPTDNAIYVDEDPADFSVSFLERVFMKNKASYKAVIYRDGSLQGGFWSGRATDRQINSRAGELSNYWIIDFLASRFTVTPAAGTRRLAIAIREAVKHADIDLKHEINAAATLAPGLAGQSVSIDEFCERFSLSEGARNAISGQARTPEIAAEAFQFDLEEYQGFIAFRSVDLDNGATLTAPSSEFDSVFRQETVNEAERRVQFATEGTIVNERLKANG